MLKIVFQIDRFTIGFKLIMIIQYKFEKENETSAQYITTNCIPFTFKHNILLRASKILYFLFLCSKLFFSKIISSLYLYLNAK